jgi:hypothetical protein
LEEVVRQFVVTTALAALALVLAASALKGNSAAAGSERASGSLNLNSTLGLVSVIGGCPPGVPATGCAARTSRGPFAGLGQVAGTYTFGSKVGPPCANGWGKALAYPVRFAIASKGDILFQLAEGSECVNEETAFAVRAQTQAFTVTGGTGIYAGVSGTGIVTRRLSSTPAGAAGTEMWTGTLIVPGLDFDLTAPTLSGATSKTVKAKRRAKSARVTYRVSAQDDRDGTVPVTCSPKSGTRFEIGRTKVICSATDTSANTTGASFTISVKATR